MSGGNGINKYQLVDRENYITNLKFKGTYFDQRIIPAATTNVPLTGQQILGDLLFTNTTVSPVTFAAGVSSGTIQQLMSGQNNPTFAGLIGAGSQWTINIDNTDNVAKTVNLPAGFTPATLTIPASSYTTLTFENINGLPNCSIRLVSQYSTTLPSGLPTPVSGVASWTGQQVQAPFVVGPRTGAVTAAAGDYLGSMINNDSGVAGTTVTDALNTLNSVTYVNSFTPYTGIGPRIGAVMASAGDYTASQIDNVPAGNTNTPYAPAAATNVQSAIDTIAPYAPPPIAMVDHGIGTAVPVGAWTALNTPFLSHAIRDTISVLSQGVGPNGITVGAYGALPNFAAQISIFVTISWGIQAATDFFGVRIRSSSTGIIATNIIPVDQIAAPPTQSVSISTTTIQAVGTTFTVEVLNQSTVPQNFQTNLHVLYLGPVAA